MNEFVKSVQALIERAKVLHARERTATIDSIDIIGALDRMRAHCVLNVSSQYFAEYIGLTPSTYWRRAQVARAIARFPRARAMLLAGETEVSHLALVAAKLTDANQDLLLRGIKYKSRRDVAAFASRVTMDGRLLPQEATVDLTLTLTEAQLRTVDRAREVMAAGGKVHSLVGIVMRGLEDLLDKRDPMRKAARSAKRKAANLPPPTEEPSAFVQTLRVAPASERMSADEHTWEDPPPVEESPSGATLLEVPPPVEEDLALSTSLPIARARPRTAIPAAIEHAVWLRDDGQCTHRFRDGTRCNERMMLELDHLQLWCRGGQHTLVNLVLKCRLHNNFAAEVSLGREWMAGRLSKRERSLAGLGGLPRPI